MPQNAVVTEPTLERYRFDYGDSAAVWGFQDAFDDVSDLARLMGHEELVPLPDEFGSESVLDKGFELAYLWQCVYEMPGQPVFDGVISFAV